MSNYVYAASCGCEHVSSIRRTEGVTVQCRQHGRVRLTDGDFIPPHLTREDREQASVSVV